MDPEAADLVRPFSTTFHGLAPVEPGPNDANAFVDVLVTLHGRLGLIAVHRPADVLERLGWYGAVNADQNGGQLTAVLRSWETRFGAVLVGVGFDTVTLAVLRPPKSLHDAERVALEHYSFDADLQQNLGNLPDYAPLLVRTRAWSFWWD